MEFLKEKFFDSENSINHFIDINNNLLKIEKKELLSNEIKKSFVNNFILGLIGQNIINQEIINSVGDTNAWSIDFPSWHGEFNIEKEKNIFIIGSEPHIHFKYLQTVYGFNNEKKTEDYLSNDHPIFKFLSELLSEKLHLTKEKVLEECYITDLFPLSPFRGNKEEKLSVGSTEKIQEVIGKNGKWTNIRFNYAKRNLPFEIKNVKPKIIITQGKEVFQEVINILNIKEKIIIIPIIPKSGKRQFIRNVKWNNITIISVPHIGSQRMRTFWNNNIDDVKNEINNIQ